MKDMQRVVDSKSTPGNSTISTSSSCKLKTNSNREISTAISDDSVESELMKAIDDVADLFPDGDTNTLMTWGSANDMQRPIGTVKLLSAVRYLRDETAPEQKHGDVQVINGGRSSDSDNDSGIIGILDNFERKKNTTNIKIISGEDDETEVLADFNKDLMPHSVQVQSKDPTLINLNNDLIPRSVQVQSKESKSENFFTPRKARKLQSVLQRAREEVEILKYNNEQYKSQIEHMQEKHKSELTLAEDRGTKQLSELISTFKLAEDRAKHQLSELKSMYQNEIDTAIKEKDAAVLEADNVAAKYTETEEKLMEIMQNKVDNLKAAQALEISERIEEERQAAVINKEKEIFERLEAFKKSSEIEVEKIKKKCDERVEIEVDKASEENRVRLKQDDFISELTTQIDDLRNERDSTTEILKSVKRKFEEEHPEEMFQWEILMSFSDNPEEHSKSSDFEIGEALQEIFGMFNYLRENAEKNAAVANELFQNESKKGPTLRHRAEIEQLKKENERKNEIVQKLEEDFKALSRENKLLEEKYKTASESHKLNQSKKGHTLRHRAEIEQLKKEKERKNELIKKLQEDFKALSHENKLLEERYKNVMVTGQRESANQKVRKEGGQLSTGSVGHSMIDQENDPKLQTPQRIETDNLLDSELRYALSIPTSKTRNTAKPLRFFKAGEKKDSKLQTPKFTEKDTRVDRKLQKSLSTSSLYSLTSKDPSETGKTCEDRFDSQRASSNIPPSPQRNESPSTRKARYFQLCHSKFPPRYLSRNSPSHHALALSNNSPNVGNQIRGAEDQGVVVVNMSNSDSFTKNYIRKKDTTLSNAQNESKQKKKNKELVLKEENESLEEKIQYGSNKLSSEEKVKISREKSSNILARKKLSNLRNFKTKQGEGSRDGSMRMNSMKVDDKEVEEKKQKIDVLRRARMFRTYRDDSSRRLTRSIDDKISSVHTNDQVPSNELIENNLENSNGKPKLSFIEASDGGDQIGINNNSSDDDSKCLENGTKLGMLTPGKGKLFENLISQVESNDDLQIPPPPPPPPPLLNDRNGDRSFQNGNANGESAPFREHSSTLNLKKPPAVDDSVHSEVCGPKKSSASIGSNRFSALKSRIRVKKI